MLKTEPLFTESKVFFRQKYVDLGVSVSIHFQCIVISRSCKATTALVLPHQIQPLLCKCSSGLEHVFVEGGGTAQVIFLKCFISSSQYLRLLTHHPHLSATDPVLPVTDTGIYFLVFGSSLIK